MAIVEVELQVSPGIGPVHAGDTSGISDGPNNSFNSTLVFMDVGRQSKDDFERNVFLRFDLSFIPEPPDGKILNSQLCLTTLQDTTGPIEYKVGVILRGENQPTPPAVDDRRWTIAGFNFDAGGGPPDFQRSYAFPTLLFPDALPHPTQDSSTAVESGSLRFDPTFDSQGLWVHTNNVNQNARPYVAEQVVTIGDFGGEAVDAFKLTDQLEGSRNNPNTPGQAAIVIDSAAVPAELALWRIYSSSEPILARRPYLRLRYEDLTIPDPVPVVGCPEGTGRALTAVSGRSDAQAGVSGSLEGGAAVAGLPGAFGAVRGSAVVRSAVSGEARRCPEGE